jgi:DNA phosphorothioation-dependent restriction protein DptG
MDTAAAATMMKMLESIPDSLQEDVVEHMRDYIEDIRDEAKWKESFSRTQDKLIAAARQARQEVAEGKATPMDVDKL